MKKFVAITGVVLLAGSLMGASAPPQPTPGGADTVAEYLAAHPEVQVADKAALKSSQVSVIGKDGQVLDVISGDTSIQRSTATTSVAAAAASCGYQSSTYITLSYVLSLDGCGILGYDSTATWSYNWYQPQGLYNAGPACVQGRGYYNGNNLTRWYSAGCARSGGTTAYIGNRLTVAKMRGYVVVVGTIGYTQWR